jgi:TPR repeat protein
LYPQGQYSIAVHKLKDEIIVYKSAISGKIQDCEYYLQKYPRGHFVDEVKQRKQQFIVHEKPPENKHDSIKSNIDRNIHITKQPEAVHTHEIKTVRVEKFDSKLSEQAVAFVNILNDLISKKYISKNYVTKIDTLFPEEPVIAKIMELMKKGLRILRNKAEMGDTCAQVELGKRLYKGSWPLTKNILGAVKWYQFASDHGSAKGSFLLAELYNTSKLIMDKDKAFQLYLKSAQLGNLQSMLKLAVYYYYGDGAPKDPSEAIKWYNKAADAGSSQAQDFIGNCYLNGIVISQNYQEAIRYFNRAAQQNNIDAINNLGILYMNGVGVSRDLKEAEKWFSKGAGFGDDTCRKNLDKLRSLKAENSKNENNR